MEFALEHSRTGITTGSSLCLQIQTPSLRSHIEGKIIKHATLEEVIGRRRWIWYQAPPDHLGITNQIVVSRSQSASAKV